MIVRACVVGFVLLSFFLLSGTAVLAKSDSDPLLIAIDADFSTVAGSGVGVQTRKRRIRGGRSKS